MWLPCYCLLIDFVFKFPNKCSLPSELFFFLPLFALSSTQVCPRCPAPQSKGLEFSDEKIIYFWSGCEFGSGLIFSIFSSWLVNLVKVDHRRETFNTIFCSLLLVVDPAKICDCEYGAIVSQPSRVNGYSNGPTSGAWLGTRFHWPRHLCAPSSQWTCVTMIHSLIRIIYATPTILTMNS